MKNITALIACSLLLVSLGCTKGESPDKGAAKPDTQSKAEKTAASPSEKPAPKEPEKELSGEEILDRMITAYRDAKSYSDHGQLRFHAVVNGKNVNHTLPFMLAMERPNKLRMEVYDATIVSNSEGFFGSIESIPNQVMQKPALEKITIFSLFSDMSLAKTWMEVNVDGIIIPFPPAQVQLLFWNNPLKELLAGVEKIGLLDTGEIDGHVCHRIRFVRPDGVGTYWIDSKTYVLRRYVMPTGFVSEQLSRAGRVDSVSLVAEFTNAQLNGKIQPIAFQLEIPKGAEIVEQFLPKPIRMLGQKAPNLQFVGLDGKPVDIESLKGKVVVLDFWATWCGPCRESLPYTDKIYQQFKDNPKVAFFAVSVDEPETNNEQLKKTFQQLKVNIPILRDPDKTAAALQFNAIPTMYVIGMNGILQVCNIGGDPKLAEGVLAKIDALLAGKNTYEQSKREYGEVLQRLVQMVAEELSAADDDSSDKRKIDERPLPEMKTAPRSEPTRLKLTRLWKCEKVTLPGNILVVQDGKRPPRLLTVENWKSVAEVGLDGKLIALHKLDLAEGESVYSLRTAVAADGKRYYLAFLIAQQRCHIYDENWKLVAHFPKDALKNRHTGISDAEIGDLDGDGKPNIYVSYWGLVGVQGASFEGQRLWANRSLSSVDCIAISGPNANRNRDLFCTSGSRDIVVLDDKGNRKADFSVRGCSHFQWLATADLRGDGRWLWCGMAEPRMGGNIAVGFAPNGTMLWNYAMPNAIPQYPVDPVIPGRITREGAGQWLLPGSDGSIHIISADGVLIDKFNSGATLHGLGTVEIDGRPSLIVATDGGIEAMAIDLR